MSTWLRVAFALVTLSSTALAQTPEPEEQPPPPEEEEKKEPKRGDFDGGAQVRLPNGPDEMGEFATFNWIAVDAKGKYFLLDSVSINGFIPMAVKKPEDLFGGTVDPRFFGGFAVTLDAKLPKGPFQPKSMKDTEAGLLLTGAYMREGAMLLSEKDFPLYAGDFHPGLAAGLRARVKMSSVVDFTMAPVWVYQGGEVESAQAVQIPIALVLGLGDLIKVSTDLGIYTGDDYTFRSSKGGRVSLGAALDVKIGKILAHAGAGVASLGTGDSSIYPTLADAVYIELNAKYVK